MDIANMNWSDTDDEEPPPPPPSNLTPHKRKFLLEETTSTLNPIERRSRDLASSSISNFNNARRDQPSSSRSKVDFRMDGNAGVRLFLPPSFKSGPTSRLPGSADPGEGDERPSDQDARSMYEDAIQTLCQPKSEDDLPEGVLTVTLLKHQKIALAWMVQREKSIHCAGGILADDQGLGKTISMIALIQKRRVQQKKFKSTRSFQENSEALNLDDEDEEESTKTDKECETSDTKQKHVNEECETSDMEQKQVDKECETSDVKQKKVATTSICKSEKWKPPAGTLVVCPATILRQWAHELRDKVTRRAKLSVLMYHGGTRTRDPADLAKYDVVLTTYTIVTNEVPKQVVVDNDDEEQRDPEGNSSDKKGKKRGKKNKDSIDHDSGPLARVRWFRIILDEAQSIKNHRTLVSRACCGLRARSRWCLSGTPIQNSVDDLYSYFRFLKYNPYAVYSNFCKLIKHPISKNVKKGYRSLQALLRIILLRRTKGTLLDGEPVVKLPPKRAILKKMDFSVEERSFYLELEADSRRKFKAYAAAGTVKQNYANILLMLLRLRQACDHPALVKGFRPDTVGKVSLQMARQLPKDMLGNLLDQLEDSMAICRLCHDPPEDGVVTMCGHVFCFQCVSERLNGDDNVCPVAGCKDMLEKEYIFSKAVLQSCISDEFDDNNALTCMLASEDETSVVQSSYVSSKIKAVLEILNSLCSPIYRICSEDYQADDFVPDPEISTPAKAIVFSQWTGMLDLVEFSLNSHLIQYRRLDGSMSLNSRDTAVQEFNNDPEVTVMLMSLKAGNLGLNMVAACHVILLDLWWNPSAEDQAVDRAHRIGQTRPVTVTRITIKDTVEERILALQEEKRKIASSAFGDRVGSAAARLKSDDLKYLFGYDDDDY